jgi:hypothetical protein
MSRPEDEDDAPLADDGGAVPDDMPLERREGDEAAERPRRTERQEPEPRPPGRGA